MVNVDARAVRCGLCIMDCELHTGRLLVACALCFVCFMFLRVFLWRYVAHNYMSDERHARYVHHIHVYAYMCNNMHGTRARKFVLDFEDAAPEFVLKSPL